MASIVKRKKKYSVVYTYTDENGNKRQKWETFETNAEAKKRKLQVEYEQESGTFIPPSPIGWERRIFYERRKILSQISASGGKR